MTTAYGELADELLRLAAALRAGTFAPVVPSDAVESGEPDDAPGPTPPTSMASIFLESLGGITAYVLVASGVLVVTFNLAFRLFPPIR
jgi:hypothetical protein